ncbi:unnamed protein product [Mytilus coruscus]|uniref:DZIP3-like HEPN domain-containing protein n=1 Tax=Mytilus coruscus TaxID=42192 RepID=A0A6J8BEM1_MYTCO|nr:unnamed protein product [Mytilus coruscus]
MDPDNRRRYFVVGSVILEIVTPVFRQRLEKDYKGKGLGCLQDFINSKPVIHILFHLRHTNIKCCVDSTNCRNRRKLPLNYSQWDLLYTENPGPPKHHCHCLYTTNNVKLDDLDISLASLILLNCCNLTPNEETLIKELREFKNNYLSHNTKGAITEKEYQTLWNDLMTYVLQLDPSKQDDFIRIQNRPLDDSLCNKYFVCLLDIHKKLEEISDKLESSTAEILTAMNINNGQSNMELLTKLEEILHYVRWQSSKEKTDRHGIKQQHLIQQYKLGQSIFTLHHQTVLPSAVYDDLVGYVTDIVMMDDGRLVVCLPDQDRLLICNTDGSQVDSIDVQGKPWCVTAVNNSTLAVILYDGEFIEMFDINNKLKLKSISLLPMWWWGGITTINNKLVVGDVNRLLIIDHQTGEVVQTIQTGCCPDRLHGSGDRIFYYDYYYNNNNNLYWYSYTDDRHHTLTLSSPPWRMTTLQDGSLYVMCRDGSVQHVSSDGKQYKTVKNLQSTSLYGVIHYNLKQKKLVTIQNKHVTVFNEI